MSISIETFSYKELVASSQSQGIRRKHL